MDRRNMESRNRMYATIGRMQKLLCKNDCVTDAKDGVKRYENGFNVTLHEDTLCKPRQ